MKNTQQINVIDPNDPIHEAMERVMTKGLEQGKSKLQMMEEMFPDAFPKEPINEVETEEGAEELGKLRLARWKHQNQQLLGKKKS